MRPATSWVRAASGSGSRSRHPRRETPIRPQARPPHRRCRGGTEMTLFAAFTPPAHQAVVRSGRLAADAGRRVLSTDFLLLGFTEVDDLDPPLERLGITAAAVRAQIDQQPGGAPPGDRELLASLGIDLDEVRRRAGLATSISPDDPNLWRLCRSACSRSASSWWARPATCSSTVAAAR
jgi:hypothetical protein